MLLLVFFLILFFIILIGYQCIEVLFKKRIREGAKNKSDNSGNNDDSGDSGGSGDLDQTVQDLSGNVSELQTQVNGILQAQQQYTNQMAPPEPTITGSLD